MAPIYKVLSKQQWEAAKSKGIFEGSEIDITDGFIHFSAADQVDETIAKHFAGQADLLLVEFESEELGENLKWEPSRGGALFPHLYESLPTAKAKSVVPVPVGE